MVEKVTDIKKVREGDFIRVIEVSKKVPTNKRLNFTGEVQLNNGTHIELLSFEFRAGIPFDTKNFEFTKLKRAPGGWAEFKKMGIPPSTDKITKSKPIKTIKQQVFDLVKSNPRKGLPGLLKLAKSEIGGDEALLQSHIDLALIKLRS